MYITIELNLAAIIVIVVVLLVEIIFRPRLDKTGDGKVVLWYGRRRRHYYILKR